MKRSIILLITLCLVSSLLYAEEVFRLKTGEIYSGTIKNVDDKTITIATKAGNIIEIPRDQILAGKETESLNKPENKKIKDPEKTEIETIYLKDGSIIKGEIIEASLVSITIKSGFGEIALKKEDIKRIEFGEPEKESTQPNREQPALRNTGVPQPYAGTGFLGSLMVDSFPPKGSVYLNDELVGKTPVTKSNIEAGVYKLSIVTGNGINFQGNVQVPIGKMEKVYIKMDRNESVRIENPGYAYEPKFGIQLRAFEENSGYFNAGLVWYMPYFRLAGTVPIISPVYAYSSTLNIPFKIEGLANIPFDWFSLQLGVSYSHFKYQYSYYSLSDYSLEYNIIGFPIGFEFFFNSNLSFDFHFGPAFAQILMIDPYFSGNYSFVGLGFCYDVGGLNIYF